MAAGVRYAVTERGLWTSSAPTLTSARAAGRDGSAGRPTIKMNVRIQPELFAQNAGRKKCQNMPLYLKKSSEYRLGVGRFSARELADGVHHR